MAILDNYTFRPLLAIFRLSSREFNLRSYYIHLMCTWCRDLYIRALLHNVISMCGGMVVLVATVKFEGSGPLYYREACSSSFLLIGVVLWGGRNDLECRSLALRVYPWSFWPPHNTTPIKRKEEELTSP